MAETFILLQAWCTLFRITSAFRSDIAGLCLSNIYNQQILRYTSNLKIGRPMLRRAQYGEILSNTGEEGLEDSCKSMYL